MEYTSDYVAFLEELTWLLLECGFESTILQICDEVESLTCKN